MHMEKEPLDSLCAGNIFDDVFSAGCQHAEIVSPPAHKYSTRKIEACCKLPIQDNFISACDNSSHSLDGKRQSFSRGAVGSCSQAGSF